MNNQNCLRCGQASSLTVLKLLMGLLFTMLSTSFWAQNPQQWTKDGNAYWTNEKGSIVQYTLPEQTRSVISDAALLTTA